MQQLIEVLKAKGVDWSEEQVSQFLESQGVSGELSSEQVVDLANKATALGKKATTKPKRTKKVENLNFTKLTKTTGQELDALVGEVKQGATIASQRAGQEMFEAIAYIPNGAIEHFQELAESHQGDVEGFRQLGAEIAQSLLSVG